MSRFKKYFAYVVYITGATLLFLYILFPSDTVKDYIEYRAGSVAPGITCYMENLAPAIPPGLLLSNMYILSEDESLVRLDSIRLSPAWRTFLSMEPGIRMTAAAAKGDIDGTVKMRGGGDNRMLIGNISASSIDLEDLFALELFFPAAFSGSLSATARYETAVRHIDRFEGTGHATVSISGFRMNPHESILGVLDRLEFSSMEAEMTVENDRVRIDRLDLSGQQVSAQGSGTVTLRFPMEASRINLEGTVELHPQMLSRFRPLLPGQYQRDGRIPVRITGTLERPRYAIR